MVHLRSSDSGSDVEPSAKYLGCGQMFTVLSESVSRFKANHFAFQNLYLSAMIQGDGCLPGEDRVHMVGTEVVAHKAGLL